MNVKSLFSVAALVSAAFSAHAALPDEYTLNQNYPTPVASAAKAPRVAERVAQVDEYQRNNPVTATSGVQVLQRAQVSAEAREARRLGLIAEGEAAAPVPTAVQAARIHQAGIDAVQHHVATN